MKIGAVVVIYKTSIKKIKKIYNSIKSQVDFIVFVNNDKKSYFLYHKNFKLINLNNNYGIGFAQNIGITQLIKNNFKYVILVDQDTELPGDYINMVLPFFTKEVSCITLNLFDNNKKKYSGFIRRNFFFRNSINRSENNFDLLSRESVTETMSSGMVIDLKKIKKIGLMNEDFFLDWIDFEWCWRSYKNGYKILGFKNIIAKHFLGLKNIKILNYKFHIHDLIRYYYIIRNGIYISIYSKINLMWKINILMNTLRYIFGYLLLVENKKILVKYIIIGVYHGLFGNLGKYKSKI
jgi:rhamnosyltransferase